MLSQLEDYGFCPRGEAGAFVSSGALRKGGALPVTTHGGQISEPPSPDGPDRTLATILAPEGNPIGLAAHAR